MRIAQVAPLFESIPPVKYGGTERVVASLVNELVGMGHEVTLYASGDSKTRGRLVPLVERALWRSGIADIEVSLHEMELNRVTRESKRFDVVHSHIDHLGLRFGRSSRTPFVHTLHGRLDLPEIQRRYHPFADARVVSISNSQRHPLPHANWVGCVYNGMPMESLSLGTGRGGYLAFVGRISREKGVAAAIDIALRAEMPLKIAARLPLEQISDRWVADDWAYYCDEVKPRLKSSLIEFVGEVGDEEKGSLLKDALGLLFPIDWPEPFGLVMIEALACGTPVIARNMGSVPEIIDHGRTGFICSSVDEMVEACRLLPDLDRRFCRQEAERRFSANAMARGYVEVYERLVGLPTQIVRHGPRELHPLSA